MAEITKYDHIIAGAGLAGLSLAYRLSLDPRYKDKKLLLIDKETKTKNDRTWCFWAKKESHFEEIVHHRWPDIRFASSEINKNYQISPYEYKMIRGIDFYNYTRAQLATAANITIIQAEIEKLSEDAEGATAWTSSGKYEASYIFKSFPDKLNHTEDQFVWQHFKGWIIETEEECFDPNEAMIMDFRVEQEGETRFFYVLPTSKKRALVEFTIFSDTISEPEYYDQFLKKYISEKLGIDSYSVEEEEVGAIPMTTYNFQQSRSARIIPIGTNGGSVKASSGYAFTRIQRDIEKLLPAIVQDKLDAFSLSRNRYTFYDKIMLNAILTGKTSGVEVFTRLFGKLSPQTIFKFLDEEGSFFTDLKIFTAPPTLPFLKAFFEELRK